MSFVFGLLCISAALELSLHLVHPRHKKIRAGIGIPAGLFLMGVSTQWLVYSWNVFSVLLVLLSGYRLFNIARGLKGRMHDAYLLQVTRQSSYWLVGAQIMLVGGWALWQRVSVSSLQVWKLLIALQVLAAIAMAWTTRQHARRMRAADSLQPLPTQDLPSVTVAIPARNESDALQACIDGLLASDYPKLEILVLDDCSQSTRTPDIIRSFAHKGVRFLQGRPPATNWLAKNQAYDDLAKAASGEWLVFIGVDVQLAPDSLRKLVTYTLQKHKSMVCVMPLNSQRERFTLVQPIRYFWELALPRKLFNRPPVLSSCWLIRRAALQKAGGFAAASRMIIPEAYFAKQQLAQDGYSFIAGGNRFGVMSDKDIAAQRRTTVRVAYPQLHRRPEMVAATTLTAIVWLLTLAMLTVEAIVWREVPVLALAGGILAWSLYGYMYWTVLRLAYAQPTFVSLLAFPAAIVGYIMLLQYSMYKYEFSEVLWKGRNVCLPVMHVVPRLPKL